MLISAIYAYQPKYKNRAVYASQQANAVLCLSARLMLISGTICRRLSLSVWKKIEIDYLETTTFSATVCPTQVFCSRQIK
jgi:hypothetical protein